MASRTRAKRAVAAAAGVADAAPRPVNVAAATPSPEPSPEQPAPRPQASAASAQPSAPSSASAALTSASAAATRFLAALDRLPPIRLPIGPAIPWRLGLPALVAAAVLVAIVSRPAPRAESASVRLPAEETYAVQRDAPLFAESRTAAESDTAASSTALGVADPPGLGLDFVADIGIKLVAVLGLAYGSLTLLKRAGVGGPSVARAAAGASAGLRVVSSLALAPNRTVHVLQVPGGKTLLIGATPNQLNLLADLGELPALDLAPDGPSFLDVLASKLPHS